MRGKKEAFDGHQIDWTVAGSVNIKTGVYIERDNRHGILVPLSSLHKRKWKQQIIALFNRNMVNTGMGGNCPQEVE